LASQPIKYDGKSILDSFGGAKFSAVDGKLPPDYLSTLIAIEAINLRGKQQCLTKGTTSSNALLSYDRSALCLLSLSLFLFEFYRAGEDHQWPRITSQNVISNPISAGSMDKVSFIDFSLTVTVFEDMR
jgi:hypothetical protein